MKLLFFLICFGISSTLFAALEKTNTISQQEVQTIGASGPQADSPFIIEQEEAQQAAAQAATNPIYRNVLLKPHRSLLDGIKKTFLSLVHLFTISPAQKAPPPLQLTIEPSPFSVENTPELTVTFKITNNKKETLLLSFPTNQRLDILIKEPSGNVLTRWSADRDFDPFPGLLTVNEKESVVFTEKIPTAGMHSGETYTIEAALVGQQGYSISQQVTPE